MTSTTTGPGLLGSRHDRAFHHLQGREKARHADGEAGRRNGLGAEAADEAVIAPAAADRAEADGASVLVLHLEGQLGLVDRAGVVFEAAHDGGVDGDAVLVTGGGDERSDFRQFIGSFEATRGGADDLAQVLDRRGIVRALGVREGEHAVDGIGLEPGALGEIAALVLATCAEELAHALGAEAVELVDGAQHGQALTGLVLAAEADGFEHAVENLAVVDLDDEVARA